MEVRLATEDDIFDIVGLARKFHKEVDYVLPFDKNQLRAHLEQMLPGVFVAEEDGEAIGFLVLATGQTIFSTSNVAVAHGIYLIPSRRNYRNARKLFKQFEEWAQENDCETMSASDQVAFMDLEELYEHMGFELIERVYIKVR